MARFLIEIQDNPEKGNLKLNIKADPEFDFNTTPDHQLTKAQILGLHLLQCIQKVQKD